MPNKLKVARAAERHHKEQPAGHADGTSRDGLVVPDSEEPLLTDAWYSTNDLAACLRVDASTLRRWRTAQPPQGPPFVAFSERVVMYSARDVEEWIRRRRTVPAKECNGR